MQTITKLPLAEIPTDAIPESASGLIQLVDASELGWKPGCFWHAFNYTNHSGTAATYAFDRWIRTAEGEIFAALYTTANKTHTFDIHVMND